MWFYKARAFIQLPCVGQALGFVYWSCMCSHCFPMILAASIVREPQAGLVFHFHLQCLFRLMTDWLLFWLVGWFLPDFCWFFKNWGISATFDDFFLLLSCNSAIHLMLFLSFLTQYLRVLQWGNNLGYSHIVDVAAHICKLCLVIILNLALAFL